MKINFAKRYGRYHNLACFLTDYHILMTLSVSVLLEGKRDGVVKLSLLISQVIMEILQLMHAIFH